MGLTEFRTKHLPHITPLVFLCAMFVWANGSGPLLVWLEKMQKKSKAEGLDWFDLAMTLVFLCGLIGSTILAFRSRFYTDWSDQRKKATETELIRKQEEAGKLAQLG